MEPIERATKILSGSIYLTIADIRFYFNEIRDYLNHCTEMVNFDQYILAASITKNLETIGQLLMMQWNTTCDIIISHVVSHLP